MPATRSAALARWGAWSVILVVALVYAGSFRVPFLLDDQQLVRDNPALRSLWPPWKPMAGFGSNRPLCFFTFALNHAVHGIEVWGYHLVNLGIHLANCLLLFDLVQRTWRRLPQHVADQERGMLLGLVAALIWGVHPLNVGAVSYIYQRLESLMALWLLLTLWWFARSVESNTPRGKLFCSIVCCACGMATKEVMVVAPVLVYLYDALYVSRGWLSPLRARGVYYAGLTSTWLILLALLLSWNRFDEAGQLQSAALAPWTYAVNQAPVILHYLRLSFWPVGLCFDYWWKPASDLWVLWPAVLAVGCLIAATLTAVLFRHPAGFPAAWLFVILSPTSSIAPLSDLAVEYRMYAPLMGLVVLTVVAIDLLLERMRQRRFLVSTVLVLIAATTLGMLTIQRNETFSDREQLWRNTLEQAPHNPRAWTNLGIEYIETGRYAAAVEALSEALRVMPNHDIALLRRAEASLELGDFEQTIHDATSVIDQPALDKVVIPHAFHLRGQAQRSLGRPELAVADFSEGLDLWPDNPGLLNDRGVGYLLLQDNQAALDDFTAALERGLRTPRVYTNRGVAHKRLGMYHLAAEDYTSAIRLDPGFPDAYFNRGLLFLELGEVSQGRADLLTYQRLRGDLPEELLRQLMPSGPNDR